MKQLIRILFVILISAPALQAQKVYIIPTLHQLHQTNWRYNYDSLKNVVAAIHPDLIATAMRPEDMKMDSNYLKANYAYEVWMMLYWFPDIPEEGFNWLGAELEGKPIPKDYWYYPTFRNQLERELDADSTVNSVLSRCKKYETERLAIVENNSLKGIYNSNDPILTKVYYECLNDVLQNTKYAPITAFYEKSNQKMEERLGDIIKRNPGKTIVVLTGDDHYPYMREYLQRMGVQILQPPLL